MNLVGSMSHIADCRYGLSWSKVKSGHIISAGEDDFVAHWWVFDGMAVFTMMLIPGISTGTASRTTQYDLCANMLDTPDSSMCVFPYQHYQLTTQDVDWHGHYDYMFGSVSDDKNLLL